MRETGCRITKQRQILLDVILREEIGAISRKNMYQISCCMNCDKEDAGMRLCGKSERYQSDD